MICPQCGPEHIVRNGVGENGKQNHLCLLCNRQFVGNPLCHYRIPEETKALIDRLLLEKIPLVGTARAAQISERWLQYYTNDLYENVPEKLTVLPKKRGRPAVECDGCDRLSETKTTSSGSGWRLTGIPPRNYRCSRR